MMRECGFDRPRPKPSGGGKQSRSCGIKAAGF
jgi:hypothetical protein